MVAGSCFQWLNNFPDSDQLLRAFLVDEGLSVLVAEDALVVALSVFGIHSQSDYLATDRQGFHCTLILC